MNVLSVDDNAALQGSVKRWFALAKEEVPVYRIWCRAGYARGVMDYEEERERESCRHKDSEQIRSWLINTPLLNRKCFLSGRRKHQMGVPPGIFALSCQLVQHGQTIVEQADLRAHLKIHSNNTVHFDFLKRLCIVKTLCHLMK